MARHRRSAAVATKRFVVTWYRNLLVGFFGVLTLLALGVLLDVPSNPAATAYGVVLLVLLGGAAVRSWRVPTIDVGPEVVVRSFLRTRRIPVSRIRTARVGRGASVAVLPWRMPCFDLDEGATVRADEIRSLRQPSVVDDVVAELERRLRQ